MSWWRNICAKGQGSRTPPGIGSRPPIPAMRWRSCAPVNAAVELPEKSHPARRVIEEFKTAERSRLTQVCRATGLRDPDVLADELHLMLEGARVTAQSVAIGVGN